jgi:hypothetical protein
MEMSYHTTPLIAMPGKKKVGQCRAFLPCVVSAFTPQLGSSTAELIGLTLTMVLGGGFPSPVACRLLSIPAIRNWRSLVIVHWRERATGLPGSVTGALSGPDYNEHPHSTMTLEKCQ